MQCGENAECISIAHQASCRCKPNFEGNALDLIKGCQPTSYPCDGCKAREPRVCISSPDCGDAQECIEGQCRFLCFKDSECIVGERCLDGFCVPIGTRSEFALLTALTATKKSSLLIGSQTLVSLLQSPLTYRHTESHTTKRRMVNTSTLPRPRRSYLPIKRSCNQIWNRPHSQI